MAYQYNPQQQHTYPPAASPYPPPQETPQYGAQPYGQQYQPVNQPQQDWNLQPQQQQQYFSPQGQHAPSHVPPSYDGSINPDTGLPTKFNPKPKYNDLWALGLFLVQLAAFVVLSYFAITSVKDKTGKSGSQITGLFSKEGLITMCIAIGVSTVFGVIYFILTQAFPRMIIKVTFALSIFFFFAVAAYYLYLRMWIIGIISAIFAILYLFMWWSWRSRIPFAAVMLSTVTSITTAYPATLVVAFSGLVVEIAYSIYFIVVVAGCFDRFDDDPNSNSISGKLIAILVFCLFSFFWTSQVFTNIAHVTISGVFATYYFMAGSPQGMQSSPTIASLKRACTTSIGSICFGSLVIAVIQTLRALATGLRNEGDGILALVGCLLECILGCIQEIAEYINKYAFAQVAIYGKAYIPAAKDTWTILKDRGVEQIINDNLIGNVWGMGAIFGGFLSGLATYLYIEFAKPDFASSSGIRIALIVIGVIMGLQIIFTIGTVIDSGVVTTFVCLAEDPAALARTKPELFEKIRETWPEVVQGVRY